MNTKIYSKIDQLPNGAADNNIVEGCIVLEGGAFRGVYGEGVLDALMQNGINFSCTIGVSAGAMNGMNYVSGDIGRSARTNLRYRHDPRYVGFTALRNNYGVIGFDFVFGQLNQIDPLNQERFWDTRRRFIAVATNCITGCPEYFEKSTCSDIFKAIQASASMPYVSRMVMLDGQPYLDGGCSKSIPYEWALQHKFSKIVVIRTRQEEFRKPDKINKAAFMCYGKHPAFAKVLSEANREYNRECDEIQKLFRQGRLMVIAPSKPIHVGRLEGDMEKLGEIYELGYQDGLNAVNQLKIYLELDN